MAQVANTMDLRGVSCAFALAEIEQALEAHDGVIEVLCDHPTTIHETIPAYCRKQGYKLTVTPEIYPLDSQSYRLRISK